MPRTACRVVCGLSLVMTIFVPTSALVSVDFPALGRPTKQQKPDRNVTVPRYSPCPAECGVPSRRALLGAAGLVLAGCASRPHNEPVRTRTRAITYGPDRSQFGELSR